METQSPYILSMNLLFEGPDYFHNNIAIFFAFFTVLVTGPGSVKAMVGKIVVTSAGIKAAATMYFNIFSHF